MPSFAFVNVICLRGLLLIEHLIFGSKEKVIPLLMLAALAVRGRGSRAESTELARQVRADGRRRKSRPS